jgi:dethiobiotin synthetase
MSAWFIAGTDTEIGKTHAACALIAALAGRGRRVAAMKPIAAGLDAAGRNDDVERLRAVANVEIPRELMTPYLFAPAIAPHLAAEEAGVAIEIPRLVAAFRQIEALADDVVVEGVGGFRVPLNAEQDTADLAVALGLPVILVVGLRLGCLSHALLSAEAIERRGLTLAGWIGNHIDPAMDRQDANIAALKRRLNAPCLGLLPFDAERDAGRAGNCLAVELSNLSKLAP